MTKRPERNRFERALQELQITLNIARRNSLEDENDTWVLFSDQYLDMVHAGESAHHDHQLSSGRHRSS